MTGGRSKEAVMVEELQQRHRYVASVLVPDYGGKPDHKSAGERSPH